MHQVSKGDDAGARDCESRMDSDDLSARRKPACQAVSPLQALREALQAVVNLEIWKAAHVSDFSKVIAIVGASTLRSPCI